MLEISVAHWVQGRPWSPPANDDDEEMCRESGGRDTNSCVATRGNGHSELEWGQETWTRQVPCRERRWNTEKIDGDVAIHCLCLHFTLDRRVLSCMTRVSNHMQFCKRCETDRANWARHASTTTTTMARGRMIGRDGEALDVQATK